MALVIDNSTFAPEIDELFISVVRQRQDPTFYIVDRSLDIVLSPNPGEYARPAKALDSDLLLIARRLATEIESAAHSHTAVALRPPESIVRMIALSGRRRGYFAIFVEPYHPRDLLAGAGTRFHLSEREIDVVQLVMRGEGYAAIAERLSIAESTVQVHIRNIGRKTTSHNRKEIVATVLGIR